MTDIYESHPATKRWLICSAIAVILVIFIGGVTRLSNAGLSIVEWKPIVGVIPPLHTTAWVEEFAKYRGSPEYHHTPITLEQFKYIYWLEYIHRLFARLVGIVFGIPLIYFILKNKISRNLRNASVIIMMLGLSQAIIGWYMVKSGLSDKPYVSHYRLTLHLIIGMTIFSLIYWQILKQLVYEKLNIEFRRLLRLRKILHLTLGIISIQIILGAMVAGLKAGYIYNDFPLMGTKLIAPDIFYLTPLYKNFLSNPAMLQFLHRVGGMLSLGAAINLALQLRICSKHKLMIKASSSLLLLVLIQVVSGIITLIYRVPVAIASLHQVNSILVWGNLLLIYHILRGAK